MPTGFFKNALLSKLAVVAAIITAAAGAASTGGCELIADVDRSDIPDGPGAVSGTGGSGQGGLGQGGGGAGQGGGGAGQGGLGQGGGGAGQGGSAQGGGGTGGNGGCSTSDECPGTDTDCQTRTCDAGQCGFSYAPAGTSVLTQNFGDCLVSVCDGQGGLTTQNDDSDVLDDSNPCTNDTCSAGVPSNTPLAAGTACADGTAAKLCDENGACVECLAPSDCASLVCSAKQCVPAACTDNVKNGSETDIDCGGADCSPCDDGEACALNADCSSGVCTTAVCQVPACDDMVKNGDETDQDCGGAACQPCGPGAGCALDADCVGGSCSGAVCLPTCTDQVKNANETDVDCGGPLCTACNVGETCATGTDCGSGVCNGGMCASPSCGDGVVNGGEVCDDGNQDNTDACLSTCVAAACGDGFVQAGAETCDDGDQDNTDACLNTCIPAACGDTFVQAGVEACDDGNQDNTDACLNTCAAASCGDTFVQAGVETCDDGNQDNTDACPTTCAPAACGDGFVQAGTEACDDGNQNNTDACLNTCVAASCGDTFVQAGVETCDDGNQDNTDACLNTCAAASCGDTFVQAGVEACDDGNQSNTDACLNTCAAASCGDTFVQTGVEACDDGNQDNTDACTSTCAAATCGDGFVRAGIEDCDDGNQDNTDACLITCEQASCGDTFVWSGNEGCDDGNLTAGDGCSAVCLIEGCGNGVVEGIEACDDGNQDNTDGCLTTCATASCGDGFTQAGVEMCDDANADNTDACLNTCAAATCGDGFIRAGVETCDDANADNTDACLNTCAAATCGDGFIRAGVETCDDANADNTDACLNTCAAATCGDGFVRAGVEMCDDANADNTDACLNTCAAATCGDSFIRAGVETCDDANTTAGDCCSSACGIEAGCEVEPNGTAAQSAAGVVFPQSGVIKAMIKPIGDVDFLAINVTARIDLKIETFEGFAPGACPTIDTVMELRAPNGSTVLVNNDDSGINSCSLIDPAVDAGARGLNPGIYYVHVIEYQSNAQIPAYNVQLTVVATCGNGIKEGSEYCDDGNTLNGDGCTSICKLETTPEVEPNNTCGTASGPYPLTPAPGVFYSGAITPIGDFDWYSFTVPATADVYIETFDVNGPPTCASIDTEIQVFKSDCVTTLTAVQDQGGVGNCSRLDPAVNAQVRHVPPGTYIVKVNEYQNNATISGYTLNLKFTALCGDGVVEGSEECDGGATCDANCDRIPVCGDGFVDAPETCDDANANPGDGCSAACSSEAGFVCSSAGGPCTPICGDGQIKGSESCDDSNAVNGDGCDSSCKSESPPTLEVEPNSTFAEADLRAADATPILINGTSTTIAGAITPLADKDIFKMTLAAPSLVRFETFDSTGSGCATALQTTTLRLFNSALAQLYTDNTSGISSCSAIVVFLTAGTYYVQVEETGNNALLAGYRLQVKVQANVGSESEPNSVLLQSDPLPGSDVFIFGGHQVNADVDYFAVTVPAGKSIRAEIIEGSLAETCESSGIDSRLTLFNAAGTQLVDDDDDGRGFCSLIDGTGATALDPGAKGLAAGTYYLVVRASTLGNAPTGPSGQFDYSLVVTLR